MTIQEKADDILARKHADGSAGIISGGSSVVIAAASNDELLIRLAQDRDALLKALKRGLSALDDQCKVSEVYYDETCDIRREMVAAIAQAERPR